MMQASASGYMYMYATSLLFYNRKSAARFEGNLLSSFDVFTSRTKTHVYAMPHCCAHIKTLIKDVQVALLANRF